MSQDPFQEHEAEKYTYPIPSRECIVKYLTKRKKSANHEELAAELNIKGEEQIEALRRRLRAMERDGRLVFTHPHSYSLPEHLDLVKGTVIGHRNGFGFLRIGDCKNDLYLPPEQMKMCIHGDQILAERIRGNRKDRCEARVISVLVPKTSQIVGRYFTNSDVCFVVPDDSRLSFDILIPPGETKEAQIGYMVVVELIQRPIGRTKAIGKIIEVLGDNMGTSMAVKMALRTHEIPYLWPKEVEDQMKNLKEEVPEASKIGRVDLRDLFLVTIDNEDARDFDDAVYCKKQHGGGWRLWVAIADVSYYVRTHTPLDIEARSRGTSVYFPSQVVPMLPEALSNGLCSLNPQVDRLCMVCEMTISRQGQLTSYKFYEAVMSSHARLTYSKVWNMLRGDQKLREQYAPLVKHIEELHNLYKTLDQAREKRGSISLENEESKFIFNAEYRIERIEQTQRNDAHKLIEECMILANISAAQFIEQAKEPALFRIHEKPTIEAVTTFRAVLAELGLELAGGKKPEPRDYAELLESIADRHDAEMLQTMLLRSMKQAIYNPENHGHFGLALQSYAHFTSPIRRYPDLSLHRAIKWLLGQSKTTKDKSVTTGAWHYTIEETLQLGHHCSMTERRADEATREVLDWLKCDFMLNQVGNIFRGVITGVTGYGFFVRLDELSIDGLVHISNLNNNYYYFDKIGQRLISESGGLIYQLGDRVEVKVEDVNMDERKINLSLISNGYMLHKVDKTDSEKEKSSACSKNYRKQSSHLNKKVNLELNKTFYAGKGKINLSKTKKENPKRQFVKSRKFFPQLEERVQKRKIRQKNFLP